VKAGRLRADTCGPGVLNRLFVPQPYMVDRYSGHSPGATLVTSGQNFGEERQAGRAPLVVHGLVIRPRLSWERQLAPGRRGSTPRRAADLQAHDPARRDRARVICPS
jgi:hypothetical protein